MEVDYDGVRRAGEGEIEQSCYCIHAPIHRDLPQAAAVFHTHMPHASALARLEDPRILPIGQTELGTMMDVAYDDTYTGPAFDPAEGTRLAGLTGDKTVLMMANHGVTTLGSSVAEAYDRLYHLEARRRCSFTPCGPVGSCAICRRQWWMRRCGNTPYR